MAIVVVVLTTYSTSLWIEKNTILIDSSIRKFLQPTLKQTSTKNHGIKTETLHFDWEKISNKETFDRTAVFKFDA